MLLYLLNCTSVPREQYLVLAQNFEHWGESCHLSAQHNRRGRIQPASRSKRMNSLKIVLKQQQRCGTAADSRWATYMKQVSKHEGVFGPMAANLPLIAAVSIKCRHPTAAKILGMIHYSSQCGLFKKCFLSIITRCSLEVQSSIRLENSDHSVFLKLYETFSTDHATSGVPLLFSHICAVVELVLLLQLTVCDIYGLVMMPMTTVRFCFVIVIVMSM